MAEAISTTLKTMNAQKSSEAAPLLRFTSRNDSPKCRYNFIRHTDTRKTNRSTATNALLSLWRAWLFLFQVRFIER